MTQPLTLVEIQVGTAEFSCEGPLPPDNHPCVYFKLDSGDTTHCTYCNTLFRNDRKPNEPSPPFQRYIYEVYGPTLGKQYDLRPGKQTILSEAYRISKQLREEKLRPIFRVGIGVFLLSLTAILALGIASFLLIRGGLSSNFDTLFGGEQQSATWGNFQALLQLSITLNIIYFSIAQFVDPDAVNQRRLIENAVKSTRDRTKYRNQIDSLIRLDNIIVARQQFDHYIFVVLRISALCCFFLSLILLLYASANATATLSMRSEILSLLLNLPFINGILYMVYLWLHVYRRIAIKRERFEGELIKAHINNVDI